MNEIVEKDINIENMIYEVNGVEVMLDSDLAKLYHVETKRINEAVKNNPEKFPRRYSFILDDSETKNLRSKISTSSLNDNNYGGRRYNPRVFTEQGVYMLATILKSKAATEVSIRIMDTFVKMRHYINYNNELLPRRFMILEEKVDNNTKRIDELFDKFSPKDIIKNCIFFENDIYDAYSVIMDIFNSSKEKIIIIDNYASKELLDMIRNINRKVLIVSKNIDEVLKKKYETQYKNVTFINNNSFHDRFIIIDRRKLYLCGASFKDLGKKCFGIHENNDIDYIKRIIKMIDL